VGRRIIQPGFTPRCNNGTVLGTYAGRLDGGIPGVPAIAIGGTITHSIGSGYNGLTTGTDTISASPFRASDGASSEESGNRALLISRVTGNG
jgi:hypothetical protein